jgi:hypothetical protein
MDQSDSHACNQNFACTYKVNSLGPSCGFCRPPNRGCMGPRLHTNTHAHAHLLRACQSDPSQACNPC